MDQGEESGFLDDEIKLLDGEEQALFSSLLQEAHKVYLIFYDLSSC